LPSGTVAVPDGSALPRPGGRHSEFSERRQVVAAQPDGQVGAVGAGQFGQQLLQQCAEVQRARHDEVERLAAERQDGQAEFAGSRACAGRTTAGAAAALDDFRLAGKQAGERGDRGGRARQHDALFAQRELHHDQARTAGAFAQQQRVPARGVLASPQWIGQALARRRASSAMLCASHGSSLPAISRRSASTPPCVDSSSQSSSSARGNSHFPVTLVAGTPPSWIIAYSVFSFRCR
jgi:hypothetical protein